MLAPEQRDLKQKAAADHLGRSEPLPVIMHQISDDSYTLLRSAPSPLENDRHGSFLQL